MFRGSSVSTFFIQRQLQPYLIQQLGLPFITLAFVSCAWPPYKWPWDVFWLGDKLRRRGHELRGKHGVSLMAGDALGREAGHNMQCLLRGHNSPAFSTLNEDDCDWLRISDGEGHNERNTVRESTKRGRESLRMDFFLFFTSLWK